MTEPVTTMSLDDEMPWRPMFEGTQDFYDDCGFAITAETDEHDIMLGNFIYFFQGGPDRPNSKWLGDGLANNSLIVITPKDRRTLGIEDNNFSRCGMNIDGYYKYDDLQVTRTADSVTWKLGDIEYYCKPPYWELRGKTGEAEFDLRFEQMNLPAVWSYGTRENAVHTGLGGGYVYVNATGTLTVAGKTYAVRNAHGVHERLGFTDKFNTIQGVTQDKTGFGSAFGFHMLGGDVKIWGLNTYEQPMFFLTVEGQSINYLFGQEGVTTRYGFFDPWHDRRSGLYMPTRWQIECDGPHGKLQLEAKALGRAYYPWEYKKGYQMMYWVLCICEGSFTHPDGRVVEIRQQLAQNEIVKITMMHDERMSGPVVPGGSASGHAL